MNNIDIEKMKREIKVKVGGTVVFCGLLFTLMGCGKTVVDTTVEQQPTQTIETTIDDPVVDVPVVEPTVDVSDNENADKEALLETATVAQTGENEYGDLVYSLNVECPDNSNSPELQALLSNHAYDECIDVFNRSYNYPSALLNGIIVNNGGMNGANPAGLNFDYFKDKPIELKIFMQGKYDGTQYVVLTDNPELYPSDYYTVSSSVVNSSTPSVEMFRAYGAVLRQCIEISDGNLSFATARFCDPENWDRAIQACMDETGLTRKELNANFTADFVYSHCGFDVENPNIDKDVFQYVSSDERLFILTLDENNNTIRTEYTIERDVKSYGPR